MRTAILILSAGLLLAPAPAFSSPDAKDISPAEGDWIRGAAEVIASDILRVGDHLVRLWGVDGVELPQTCLDADGGTYDCGAETASRFGSMINGQVVSCYVRDSHRRGNVDLLVGQCRSAEISDLGGFSLHSGFARPLRYQLVGTVYETAYVESYDGAVEAARGLFSGTWVAPWSYRTRNGLLPDDSVGFLKKFAAK